MGHEYTMWQCHCRKKTRFVIVNKKEKAAIIIDVAIPGDKRMINKEKEKIEKCQNLKREINRLWNLKKIDAIPGLLGVLQRTSRNM